MSRSDVQPFNLPTQCYQLLRLLKEHGDQMSRAEIPTAFDDAIDVCVHYGLIWRSSDSIGLKTAGKAALMSAKPEAVGSHSAARRQDGNGPAATDRGQERQDQGPPDPSSDDALLSPSELADIFRVDHEALRKRLERWRAKNVMNREDWVEVDNPKPNSPRYLYRVRIARPIIEKMKGKSASARTSSQRPAKYLRRSERPDS